MPPKDKKKSRKRISKRLPSKGKFSPEILVQLTEAWEKLAGKKNEYQPLPLKEVKKLMKQSLELVVESNEWPRKETIDRDDFFALAGPKLAEREKALQVFQLFDASGKGIVILEDLQRVASELGDELSPEEIQEMINEVDQSGEGMLTVEDFIKIAKVVKL